MVLLDAREEGSHLKQHAKDLSTQQKSPTHNISHLRVDNSRGRAQ